MIMRNRMSFLIKGAQSAQLMGSALIGQAPWTTIDDTGINLSLTTEWQTMTPESTTQLDYRDRVKIPFIMHRRDQTGTLPRPLAADPEQKSTAGN